MTSYNALAEQKIERGLAVAKKDNTTFTTRTIKISPKGYFSWEGIRVSRNDAIEKLAIILEQESKPLVVPAKPKKRVPAGTFWTWDSVNKATQDYFYELCEQMMEISRDASNGCPVRTGRDYLFISPQNQPRLTNLKKCGVIRSITGEKKSHKMLVLTAVGREIFENYTS
jgi:hypothetical protein